MRSDNGRRFRPVANNPCRLRRLRRDGMNGGWRGEAQEQAVGQVFGDGGEVVRHVIDENYRYDVPVADHRSDRPLRRLDGDHGKSQPQRVEMQASFFP